MLHEVTVKIDFHGMSRTFKSKADPTDLVLQLETLTNRALMELEPEDGKKQPNLYMYLEGYTCTPLVEVYIGKQVEQRVHPAVPFLESLMKAIKKD